MKKIFVCVLALLLVLLSMAACGAKNAEAPAKTPEVTQGESVQIPNPWIDCTSPEEAGKLAGFSFTAPDALEGYPEKYIAAIENDIAEVIFSNEDGAEVCLRKGVGTDDISGNYNTYAVTENQTVADQTVTCKGDGSLVYNATWNDGTYAYSVTSTLGMTAEQLTAFVQSLS